MSAKPSLRQDLAWRIEAGGLAAASALFRLFPVDWVSGWGAALFKLFGPLTPTHRLAEQNIRLAFPEMPAGERAVLLRDQWDNTGRTFFEFPITDRLTPATGRVEIVGRERLEAVARGHAATIMVSGHFANWEIMAVAFTAVGVDALVTYRAANNPYVDRMIIEGRARYGVKLFAPKGGAGSRELLAALGAGRAVAFLNDQKFNGGVAAPFFGRTVHTAEGPTRLALRFGAPILPMSVQRIRGARFRVVVDEPIHLTSTGDRKADLETGVRAINAYMERKVRERPAEWFWVHRRWPKEAYAELTAQSAT